MSLKITWYTHKVSKGNSDMAKVLVIDYRINSWIVGQWLKSTDLFHGQYGSFQMVLTSLVHWVNEAFYYALDGNRVTVVES